MQDDLDPKVFEFLKEEKYKSVLTPHTKEILYLYKKGIKQKIILQYLQGIGVTTSQSNLSKWIKKNLKKSNTVKSKKHTKNLTEKEKIENFKGDPFDYVDMKIKEKEKERKREEERRNKEEEKKSAAQRKLDKMLKKINSTRKKQEI